MTSNYEPVIRGLSTSHRCRLKRISVDRQEYARRLETHLDLILHWVRSRSVVPLSSDQSIVVDDAFLPEVADGLRKESLHNLVLANRRLTVLQDLLEENDRHGDDEPLFFYLIQNDFSEIGTYFVFDETL